MKLEQAEKFFIKELFKKSQEKMQDKSCLNLVSPLTGDASTRRYYRAHTKQNTYVICIDNPSEVETSFVKMQKFFMKKKISVPRLYDINLAKGYLLEEDLGDTTLLQDLANLNDPEEELSLYKRAVDELLKIHAVVEDGCEENKIVQDRFDYEKLKYEVDFSIKYFFKIYLNCDNEEVLEKLSNLFIPICERIAAPKMVLTHRDFHSRNIMMKNNDLYVIDFQDARWGIPQYDLASLLDDCYYRLGEENKKMLKDYYFDKMPSEIVGRRESFDAIYIDMAIQRIFKAVGSFCYIYNWRQDERYLKYIGFALENLKIHLYKNRKYDELRKLIFGLYYES